MSPCSHAVKQPTQPIKLQLPLFLATVLTNNLVILTILFLQCKQLAFYLWTNINVSSNRCVVDVINTTH